MTLTVLDLFSGIGGFSLGLERTSGFRTVAFCEIEPYCQAVLRKHWPNVPIFPDVTKLGADDVGRPDVICGGFPCQDISVAGKQAGIDGDRSGLWSEFARLIGELRPRYAIVENVTALLHNGMGRVLGDLAALRYDAEWRIISACEVGFSHTRERVFVVAYPESHHGNQWVGLHDEQPQSLQQSYPETSASIWLAPTGSPSDLDDGVPFPLAAIHALGNAVVPQVAEVIGRAILEAETTPPTEKGYGQNPQV